MDFSLDRTEQAQPAALDERAASLCHEFNNFLNGLLLHIAILERSMASGLSPELSKIREEAMRIAKLVRQFQEQGGDRVIPS